MTGTIPLNCQCRYWLLPLGIGTAMMIFTLAAVAESPLNREEMAPVYLQIVRAIRANGGSIQDCLPLK